MGAILDDLGQPILDETGAPILDDITGTTSASSAPVVLNSNPVVLGVAAPTSYAQDFTASFASRLRAVLPARWFPDKANSPALEALLEALGSNWSDLYNGVLFAGLVGRISTAPGAFLDMASLDYLGGKLTRKPGQSDAAFSARIRAEIVRPRLTRASVTRVLTDLTGRAPVIFEPARPTDTGGIGFLGMAGVAGAGSGLSIGSGSGATPNAGTSGAGGIGSLALPGQAFVTAYRATSGGIANVGGIYSLTATGWAGGGIGSLSNPSAAGAIEIAAFSQSAGQITDADIYAAVASVMPAGGIAWVSIQN